MTQSETGPVSDPLLATRALTKYYGGHRALDKVSIEVPRGEIFALVGDNGAGKSTLIKAISGALRPDAGEIVLDGDVVAFRSPRDATDSGIETVHQSLGLVDELDVPQNVFLGREITRRVVGPLRQLDKPRDEAADPRPAGAVRDRLAHAERAGPAPVRRSAPDYRDQPAAPGRAAPPGHG